MFRLHKARPAAKSSSGEKIDFKFSYFKALQVIVLVLLQVDHARLFSLD
jgi:hypothetical protein